jgi:hypothetical protein
VEPGKRKTLLPPSISLHRINLRRNDQGAVNYTDLHLRQGAAKESQPRSNKCRQEAANEQQMRSTYEKLNLWSQTNTKETFGKKDFCLDKGYKWTEGVDNNLYLNVMIKYINKN